MGLDTVELVMELEDEFGLSIPDAEAEKMMTPDDTVRFIVTQLRMRMNSHVCPTAHFFYRVRRELVGQFGIPKENIRPSSRLGDVVILPQQRKHWPQVARNLGLHVPPRMLSAPFAARFPEPSQSLRDLVESSCVVEFINFSGQVDEETVWLRVRQLTAEQMGIDEAEIHRESRYVQDLGMG